MKRQTAAVGILAIAIVGVFTSIDSIAQIPGSERAALIALYEDTFGDNWTYNTGWKGNNNELDGFSEIGSEGSWRGITVVGDHVTKIRLYTNGLTGSLPSELEDLQYLEELVFYSNRIGGDIPPELGNLSNLELLNLFNNEFNGGIPPELGNLSNLQRLYLYENQLSGSIPRISGACPI